LSTNGKEKRNVNEFLFIEDVQLLTNLTVSFFIFDH